MAEGSPRITVRVTPSEEEWIIKKAKQAGVSKSRYMRKVTLCEFPQSGEPFYQKDRQFNFKNGVTHQEIKEIFRSKFPGVTNNLNQIARKLNSGQGVDKAMIEEIKQIREQHNEIAVTIIKALRKGKP